MLEDSRQDLFIGVKAEQSLRDAVRAVIEGDEDDTGPLELAPFGRKDWIAGMRVGSSIRINQLEQKCREVLTHLLALESHQRIRIENIRQYVIPKPVPVFKDPVADVVENEFDPSSDGGEEPEEAGEPVDVLGGPSVCPICKRTVHSYNLHHNTDGKVVGCFMCGGNSTNSRG